MKLVITPQGQVVTTEAFIEVVTTVVEFLKKYPDGEVEFANRNPKAPSGHPHSSSCDCDECQQ
ncbi:MAG: hypothetical protein AB7Q00_14370 [Phycisphaerales bacterium]